VSASPALLKHCKDVYAAMERTAKQDEEGNQYWEGALTRLVEGLGLSNPYYTTTTNALKKMDCIRQARRGGGGQGSVWYLLQEPTDALFAAFASKDTSTGVGRRAEFGQLSQSVAMLTELVQKMLMRLDVVEAKMEEMKNG
jgi:hypothetical protein